MSENKKPNKSYKFGKNIIIDKPTIIFFSIMAVGLVILTLIVLLTPTSKTYIASYGDITISVEMHNDNKIDFIIDTGETKLTTNGTYKVIEDNKYSVKFDEDETELTMVVEDEKLTLIYDDGTEIIYKEK